MEVRAVVKNGTVALVVGTAVVGYATTDNPAIADVCYLGVLVGAGIAAWIGAARAPREQRLVPRLVAVGVALTALGDVLWTVLDEQGIYNDVSIADPPWFASYFVLCAAMWIVLKRSREGGRIDLGFAIDVATIVVVSVLVFWSVSIDAIVTDDSVTPFVRAVWAAYPLADAVLLALVLRVLVSRTARASIDLWFAAGVCLWLAADTAYLQSPDGPAQIFMDAAWMIAPVLMARAAWRSSDVSAERPTSAALGGWGAQITIAVGPLLVPPALELTADLRGHPDRPMLLLVGTAALITLAFIRTARLIRSEERAQRELEVARDIALEASRAKSTFLANMSHELRTPLTTVLASGELLEDTTLDDTQLQLLKKINRSGEMLKTLVESILDFSAIEAGRLQLSSRRFDLHAAVAEVADAYRARTLQAGIRFKYRLDPKVPRHVVGDPDRVYQILTNLLANAVKFTHDGQVSLIVQVENDLVEFVVSDTGIGIREEDQEAVFRSFHQVDGSTTRRYGGNGLGLTICKELTNQMGGTLTLQSQYGAGSTFVVRLPFTAVDGAPDHRAPGLEHLIS